MSLVVFYENMNLTTLIENKSKEFDKKFDIKKIINTIDTNGTIEIEHSVTKEQLNFLSQSIKAGYELAIKDVEKLECMKEEPDDADAFARDSEIAVENLNRNELRKTLKLQLQSLLKKESK